MKLKNILTLCSVLTLLTTVPPAHAGSHTWSGAFNNAWKSNPNWSAGGTPMVGESGTVLLSFPANPVSWHSTNTISYLQVDTIFLSGSGYDIGALPGIIPLQLKPPGFLTGITCAGTNNHLHLPLVLNFTNDITVNQARDLHIDGPLSGAGGFRKLNPGDLHLEGALDNTFSGLTTVLGGRLLLKKTGNAIAISGPLTIGDTNGPAHESEVLLFTDQQISLGSAVTLFSNGTLDLMNRHLTLSSLAMVGGQIHGSSYNGSSALLTLIGDVSVPPSPHSADDPTIYANVSLGGGTRTFDIVSYYDDLHINGIITGGGGNAGLIKSGEGYLYLQNDETYQGLTRVDAGVLIVSGSVSNSPFLLQAGGGLVSYGAVGTITSQGGTLIPQIAGARAMHSKDLILDAASTMEAYLDRLQTPATPFQLAVNGTVQLNGAKLVGRLMGGLDPVLGTAFTLIQNDATDAVVGTFAGLPEGATLKFYGREWQITYKGGTGNDVVLTLINQQVPLSTDRFVIDPGNHNVLIFGTGLPGVTYELHSSTNLITWLKLRDVNNNNGALDSYDFSYAQGAPLKFYKIVRP